MIFQPENNLENILMLAANDPSARLDFYKELVNSNIYTIQIKDGNETKEEVLKEGTTIQLLNVEINHKMYVPIFSSLRRLQESIDQEVNYCSMNAMDFFQLTRGADVFLNPSSSYGKEFNVDEIESILNGSIFNNINSYEVEEETQVMVGQPAIVPEELIQALSKLFATRKEIKCAYNAHFFNPQMDEKPHTLIAVEASDNWEEIVSKAGMIADSVHVPDPPVSFVQMDGSSGLEEYFKSNVRPFYTKKKLGLF
ncbi:enhanced serine sensitivity protein SseB C-terminal domain-containing protein [Paenibacillus sp. 1001270B_150601_E10]|uniref:enhanced serine sensitivity protein SseB C-terminal domain-containing protein n=1 Tax=Paenibacillus sp. 1001270B_150601_E10 TaxID=2787079 RepID=UPI00189EEBBE|nr:enhanced serine sensitivity protein SseB C-terminal domain-containing protein [Paenibacillus sp. 1001270B_150601_E10]